MKLISQSQLITCLLFCTLMYSCDITPPKNDMVMYISGQYYIVNDDNQKEKPKDEITAWGSFYQHGLSSFGGITTFDEVQRLHSEPNGEFDYCLKGLGSRYVRLFSSLIVGDTIEYQNDTTLVGKEKFQDMQLILQPMHTFNPTLTKKGDPREICFAVGDTLIFRINHDALTRIQITRYRIDTATKECIEDTIADYRVDNSLTYEFVLPDTHSRPSEDNIIREDFRIHYTTMHYGSRISPWYGIRFNSHGQ